jgi:hypothetical protein
MGRWTGRRRGHGGALRFVGQVGVEELGDRDSAPEVVAAALFAPPVRIPHELIVLHDHGDAIGPSAARGKEFESIPAIRPVFALFVIERREGCG